MIEKKSSVILYYSDGSRQEVPDAVSIDREYSEGAAMLVCRDSSQRPLDRVRADQVIGFRVRTED